jgi:hypothetical protein
MICVSYCVIDLFCRFVLAVACVTQFEKYLFGNMYNVVTSHYYAAREMDAVVVVAISLFICYLVCIYVQYN